MAVPFQDVKPGHQGKVIKDTGYLAYPATVGELDFSID